MVACPPCHPNTHTKPNQKSNKKKELQTGAGGAARQVGGVRDRGAARAHKERGRRVARRLLGRRVGGHGGGAAARLGNFHGHGSADRDRELPRAPATRKAGRECEREKKKKKKKKKTKKTPRHTERTHPANERSVVGLAWVATCPAAAQAARRRRRPGRRRRALWSPWRRTAYRRRRGLGSAEGAARVWRRGPSFHVLLSWNHSNLWYPEYRTQSGQPAAQARGHRSAAARRAAACGAPRGCAGPQPRRGARPTRRRRPGAPLPARNRPFSAGSGDKSSFRECSLRARSQRGNLRTRAPPAPVAAPRAPYGPVQCAPARQPAPGGRPRRPRAPRGATTALFSESGGGGSLESLDVTWPPRSLGGCVRPRFQGRRCAPGAVAGARRCRASPRARPPA